jgi:2-methylisocitrate lyase-like PEP mutase family enzyme
MAYPDAARTVADRAAGIRPARNVGAGPGRKVFMTAAQLALVEPILRDEAARIQARARSYADAGDDGTAADMLGDAEELRQLVAKMRTGSRS